MKTKTIRQTISFKASPTEVYEMIMDSEKHRSLSGEKALISRKVGGRFSAWGPHISGFNLALKPGKLIVQAWRARDWWPDHYSVVTFDIQKVKRGSKLKFTQIGVPPHRYAGHYNGWIEAYWNPMKNIFAERTKKVDRKDYVKGAKERILSGRF
jgi:activator of HSP90 ATPase